MTNPAETDQRPLADMTLFDPETLKCPYHFDSTLRQEAPVYQDPASGVYVVSTYDLVREVHKNSGVFSNEFVLARGADSNIDPDVRAVMDRTYDLGKGTLLTVDQPEHKDYREAVAAFFRADQVSKYTPWITSLAEELVAGLPEGEAFNFIDRFTRPLPLSVIMHVLGIPQDMFDLAFKWTVANVDVLSQIADKDTLVEAHASLKEEYDWFAKELELRRQTPKDDLLNMVAHAQYRGRDLTMEEMLSYCTQFLVAGNETTTATLAEGMRQLCLNPDQAALIKNDRSLIPNLVEESLRLASPTSNMWRLAKQDYELGGVSIPAGSMVLLKYFSSNHDDSMFADPMTFDVTRANVKRHIAFGFGPHVCIGQHLSKLEMILAWEQLFERFSSFELACPAEQLEYMPNILLRGLEEIPVILKA